MGPMTPRQKNVSRRRMLVGSILIVAVLFAGLTVALSGKASAKHQHGSQAREPAPDRQHVTSSIKAAYHITLHNLQKPAEGIASRYVITNQGTSLANTLHDYYDYAEVLIASDASEVEITRTYDLADTSAVPTGYKGYAIISADEPITGSVLSAPRPEPTPTIYVPLVMRRFGLASPLVPGDAVRFHSWLAEVPLEAVVTDSEYRSVLYPDYGDPVDPGGVFVVALMNVTNHGYDSGEVGMYGFRLEDSVGRKFDVAALEVLWAAEDEYDRESVYTPIQPGFTEPLVFVFDVLPESEGLHLVSNDPW